MSCKFLVCRSVDRGVNGQVDMRPEPFCTVAESMTARDRDKMRIQLMLNKIKTAAHITGACQCPISWEGKGEWEKCSHFVPA